ncbi:hypothetical protein CABS01_01038 [Colletotrichum abscissum]|uniref:WSC domain-containing protein n=1 Tax=Colletotrichum abscissum TaxID=1671311 RepID=A0A9P9XI47_9PEZI|nr:uncharacterized protein CABS01_01038 [Colletotrichum abscissum]KAI3554348.1 hypothetical protein CABS02_05479 [Colletotrichum abscissum]KAK1505570.1 hypothetical protein CABS01_01038 [Colletotrichum abscissum]
MARFPVARLLLALLATAFTNAQLTDQSQYSIPCVMQYVGCVLIPNFNTVFSRLLGDATLTPGKCQRFCSDLGSTYGSLYDGYYCRCSIVPETVAPVIVTVAETLCNRYHCHDIVFILDDDLSDNHGHAFDIVVTDVNLLRLLVIFVLLDGLNNVDLNNLNDLDNLNDKKHPNVPSQHPSSRPPRTSTVHRRTGVHRVPAGREPPQLHEFEFIFHHLLYFDYVFSFVEFGYSGFWDHQPSNLKHFSIIVGVIFNIVPGIIKQRQFAVLLKYNLSSDNFKPVSDLEHFSLDYTSVKRSQQRIPPHNSTAFFNISYFSLCFNPFRDVERQRSIVNYVSCLDNE